MKNLRYLLIVLLTSILGGGEIYGETTVILYQTGFETSEGFVTSNTYNNNALKAVGPENSQWSTICGTPSETSPINGKSSLQLRYYTSLKLTPYTTTDFSLDNVTQLKFNAKSTSGTYNLTIQHTTDNGTTWSEEKTYSVNTTTSEITYDFNVPTNNVRFKISWKGTVNGKGVVIDDVIIYGISNKETTSLSFGEEYDNKTITVNEGEESSFTSPTATLIAGEESLTGEIKYSSENTEVATVVESTGKVTFVSPGTTKITAKYAGNETYSPAEISYTIDYKKATVAGEIIFKSEEFNSFGKLEQGYENNTGNVIFKGSNGYDYTFNVNNVINNNGGLQLKANEGYIESPEFNFTNGYKVIVTVKTNSITLEGNGESQQGTNTQQAILIFNTPASFKISAGNKYAVIESIEIIPNTQAYTFNEQKENIITAAENVDVALVRTLDNNDWNTFCVPFNISAEQITEVFGTGTKITEFKSADEANKKMIFTQASSIEAGKPYLIKPGKEIVENPVFKGVTIVEGEPQTITNNSNYAFVGVYSPYDMKTDGTEVFVGVGGKLFVPAAGTNRINGLRAFIRFSSPTERLNTISIDGDNTSAINLIENNGAKSDNRVFSLSGQQVGKSTDGLKSGIYIVNGKKVIIK